MLWPCVIYLLSSGIRVEEAEVEKSGDSFVLKENSSTRVNARAHKMSKSRGNVVNPDAVVASHGADSLRLYEMFMGPIRDAKVCTSCVRGDSVPGGCEAAASRTAACRSCYCAFSKVEFVCKGISNTGLSLLV